MRDMRLHAAALLLLVLALVATACGGDEPAETAADPAPTTEFESPEPTEPEPEPEPVATTEEPGTGTLSTESSAGGATEAPTATPEPTETFAEGTPQDPQAGVHQAGTLTVTATRCDIVGTTIAGDESSSSSQVNPAIAVLGDQVYLANDAGQVLRFLADTSAGCTLTLDETWGEAGVFTPTEEQDALNIADTGRLVMSGSVFEAQVVDTATGASYACDVTGEVEISPDGTTGVAFFPGSPLRAVAFGDTTCTVTDPAPVAASLPFDNMTILSGLLRADGSMVVGGNLPEPNRATIVAAYDAAGAEAWRQGTEDPDDFGDQNYGWVHAVSTCGAAGICTLDTNFRSLQVLDANGAFLTAVDLNETHGIERAWWEDMEADDQGRLWMPVGAGREDGDLVDGFVFLMTFDGI